MKLNNTEVLSTSCVSSHILMDSVAAINSYDKFSKVTLANNFCIIDRNLEKSFKFCQSSSIDLKTLVHNKTISGRARFIINHILQLPSENLTLLLLRVSQNCDQSETFSH